MCHLSLFTSLSHAMFHMSYVTYHVSITPTATATDPPLANSPTMHNAYIVVGANKQEV